MANDRAEALGPAVLGAVAARVRDLVGGGPRERELRALAGAAVAQHLACRGGDLDPALTAAEAEAPALGRPARWTAVIVAGCPATGSSSGSTCSVTATPRSATVWWPDAGALSASAATAATAVAAARMEPRMAVETSCCGRAGARPLDETAPGAGPGVVGARLAHVQQAAAAGAPPARSRRATRRAASARGWGAGGWLRPSGWGVCDGAAATSPRGATGAARRRSGRSAARPAG